MIRGATVALVLAALGVPLGAARAEVCEDHVDDPVPLPWREAAVDTGRGGCLRSDLTIDLRGLALIDTPDFYGTFAGDLGFFARIVDGPLEYGLGLRALDVTYVQNAVLKVTDTGYGPVSGQVAYGGHTRLGGRELAVAAFARLELPYTRSELDGSSGGLQLGGAATWERGPRLRLHGRAALLGWYGTSTGGTTTSGAVLVGADVAWRPIPWLNLTGGLDLQGGWYGLGLDHLAVRAGVHWRITGVWRAAFALGAPVVGDERTDVAATLGLRRDLD